jgi:hypothetical protein
VVEEAMKTLQGKILKKEKVVLDNLKGRIQFHTSIGGIKAWAGRFDLSEGQSIAPGEYRLLLENGWSGIISITKVLPEQVHFLGDGALE